MKQIVFEIKSNELISEGVYEMVLSADEKREILPGQFINLKVEGFTLRRPISVCHADEKTVTILYKTPGKGTEKLSSMKAGETIDVLTELGNGFDMSKAGERPLLAGGGIGTAPLYLLAEKLIQAGKEVTVAMGFAKKEEIYYKEKFEALGAKVLVATADGSEGTKGFVTDIMDGDYTYLYTCGPKMMLKAVYDKWEGEGEFSFEERMGCGFGACVGCSMMTKAGAKRVCKDGPVFDKEVIIWED